MTYIFTSMLDFTVNPEMITEPERWAAARQRLVAELTAALPGLSALAQHQLAGGPLLLYTAPPDVTVTLRAHRSGLLSVQLESAGSAPPLDNGAVLALETRLQQAVSARRSKALLPLPRGTAPDPYFYSSDERLLQYALLETLVDERTPHQHVQLVRTREFGVALVLDGYMNIAESDEAYTRALLAGCDFRDKTALILGGGDGGVLRDLLTHQPRHVTMVEIDDLVMRQCRTHLRSVCGDCLDTYEADNYRILVGDAFAFLQKCAAEGRTFDYVIYDLTDVPVSPERDQGVWHLVRTALHDSLRVLAPGGVYLTHVTGVPSTEGLREFEKLVDQMPAKTTRTRTEALVPSFLETWVFYQITKC